MSVVLSAIPANAPFLSSSTTLVTFVPERRIDDVKFVQEIDTYPKLEGLRRWMAKDNLDY